MTATTALPARHANCQTNGREAKVSHAYFLPLSKRADSEVPVPENTTQEESNSSSKVLINTSQINLQPAEPGTSSVKPLSPNKHLYKIFPIPRLSQVTAKQRIKKTGVLLTSIDNRNALKVNLVKIFQKCKKISKKDDKTTKRKFHFESSGESHNSSLHIDECLNSIKFTTPKEKMGKIKSKKAKKDASQDDNNEQLDHTCEADVLCKECSENYHKTKKCDWLLCIMCQMWLHEDCTIFYTFLLIAVEKTGLLTNKAM
ncbi:hypothetical protein AVEN_8335-1 [Araneus ventricosus]|uniref:Uncharacterized protein n=1 Tax=Araneus ventricosus TaxID=182803 RepID=A0A4Y2UCV2_ARAVE|nr:hypothetical protein AVEN_82302-1 [Araneus ventricosus]GBO09841.1 hypothetical protein AVEN_8335-1 [Araneus ventricosus]